MSHCRLCLSGFRLPFIRTLFKLIKTWRQRARKTRNSLWGGTC